MAAPTLCLLQWKPPQCNPARCPIRLPPPATKFPTRPLRVCRPIDGFPRLSVNCCTPSSKNSALIPAKRKRDDPVGALEALKKPAAAGILLGVLLACDVSSALAASGGRIGGNSFSSRRSSSSSTSHETRSPSSVSSSSSSVSSSSSSVSSSSSSPSSSRRSHKTRSPSSVSSSSSSPSLSISYLWSPRSEDKAGHSHSSSKSSKTRSPSSEDESKSSSSKSPSSPTSYETRSPSSEDESKLSSSTSYHVPSPSGGEGGIGAGPMIVFLIISMGFGAFLLVSGFRSDRSEGEKTSILKLQVGLQGMVRPLQKDLNRIAEVADTSTPTGLSFVLTEAILALLRHPDYCISGYSSVEMKRDMEDVEKRFYQLSIEERGKFDEETLVNVNNIRKKSSTTRSSNGTSDEYIVITILVAVEGVHKLPAINGSRDLKEALQKLGSFPSRKLLAVEVLWTPQDDNDTLSEQKLLEDYPLLRPL